MSEGIVERVKAIEAIPVTEHTIKKISEKIKKYFTKGTEYVNLNSAGHCPGLLGRYRWEEQYQRPDFERAGTSTFKEISENPDLEELRIIFDNQKIILTSKPIYFLNTKDPLPPLRIGIGQNIFYLDFPYGNGTPENPFTDVYIPESSMNGSR